MPIPCCAACGVALGQPLRCSRCKTSVYCSRECQKRHWVRHKTLCRAIPPAPTASAPTTEATGHLPPAKQCRPAFEGFAAVRWVPCAQRHRPERPAPNLLLLLHGLGDSETGFARLAAGMAIPGMESLVPRGTYAVPADMGYGWYEAHEADGHLIEAGPGEERRLASLGVTRQRLHALLDQLMEDGWAARAIFVLGYGCGATAGLDAGLSYRHTLGGIAGMSGPCFLEEHEAVVDGDPAQLAARLGWQQVTTPVFLSRNGTRSGVALERFRAQSGLLQALCQTTEVHEYETEGLLQSAAEVRTFFEFLSPLMISSLHELAAEGWLVEVDPKLQAELRGRGQATDRQGES